LKSTSQKKPTYIVYAPSYNANNGGCIFLHQLVHNLNNMGERALLWPMQPIRMSKFKRYLNVKKEPDKSFKLSPDLNTALAEKKDLNDNAIVVYPEIVKGNPLNIKNVVRWLLYKPGVLHPFEFGKDEMFFKVDELCEDIEITGGAQDLFLWKVNPCYKNHKRPNRKGSCYIVRKGKEKQLVHDLDDSIKIDGKSHEEIAEIFNRCEVFYSYDEATMYSQYAAVCGCTSIVIPGMYKSREDWIANHDLAKFGVAYGLDDIAHAKETQNKVIDLLLERERAGVKTVASFIETTKEKFGSQ